MNACGKEQEPTFCDQLGVIHSTSTLPGLRGALYKQTINHVE